MTDSEYMDFVTRNRAHQFGHAMRESDLHATIALLPDAMKVAIVRRWIENRNAQIARANCTPISYEEIQTALRKMLKAHLGNDGA